MDAAVPDGVAQRFRDSVYGRHRDSWQHPDPRELHAGSGTAMNTTIQSREIAAPPRLAAGSRVSARSPIPFLAFLAGFFLISVPLVNPWVRGDGVGYYAYLRAILIDRNLHFEKDWLGANPSFRQGRVDDSGYLFPD